MKSAWVVAVLVCVVLTSSAFAQITFGLTPRAAGMGGASIGVADDVAAWFQNPAGLAALNVPCPDGSEWGHEAGAAYADIMGMDAYGISWSGWKPANNLGVGAGFVDVDGLGRALGAGFGIGSSSMPLSGGLNVININPAGPGSSDTLFNVGLMYRFEQPGRAPVRLGTTVVDVTDETGAGPFWNAGIAWPATPNLLIAMDVIDITDELDTQFSGGVEVAFGNQREWRARGGFMDFIGADPELTLGVGYSQNRWRLDFAWINAAADDIWSVGAALGF